MYRKASPSVVVIRVKGREVTTGGVARFGETGSGVLISQDGKVITASHVVHRMEDITVEFLGQDAGARPVIGFQQSADLALLQLEMVPPVPPSCELADSDTVNVGDPVFSFGAPYGLTYALSGGIVSARWKPDTVTRDFPLAEFFQTDATINTGNSGGPMFKRAGEVIGIVSHKITKSGGGYGRTRDVSKHQDVARLLAPPATDDGILASSTAIRPEAERIHKTLLEERDCVQSRRGQDRAGGTGATRLAVDEKARLRDRAMEASKARARAVARIPASDPAGSPSRPSRVSEVCRRIRLEVDGEVRTSSRDFTAHPASAGRGGREGYRPPG